MLVDEANITIEGGKGGDGIASFRHEKFVPFGGPDGGDGGNGGDVIIQTDPSVHGLNYYSNHKQFKAEKGAPGRTAKKTGKSGDDLYIKLPPGTIIYNSETNLKLYDLTESGRELVIARGGNGGWGNVHFKSSINQAPTNFNEGKPGDFIQLRLELKLIADVGLVGLPNAGKSTLISHVSSAHPKIADYPFTTLEPNLGVVNIQEYQIVIADIPGLIEGSSKGKGLGYKFLRHIERTSFILHLIDINSPDPISDYRSIRKELDNYSEILSNKPEFIALNKVDTISQQKISEIIKKFKKLDKNAHIFTISSVSGEGLNDLLLTIAKQIQLTEATTKA